MKKTLTFLILWISIGKCFSQVSSFQRIVIPAIEFELSATDVVKTVASYCTDFNRESPAIKATNFNYVHLDERCVMIGNNAPITLQEALDQKYIDIEVNGFSSLKFKDLKKTGEPIKINIKNVVIGDVQNDTKNIVLDKNLANTSDIFKQQEAQQKYWEKQSIVKSLTDLNYLNEGEINNEIALRNAIKKFQSSNGLQVDGKLGPNTNENIYANDALKKFLPGSLNDLSTSEIIRKFQNTYSIQETGRFDIETKIELTRLESINNKVNNHEPLFNFYKNKEEGEILRRVSEILSENTLFVNGDDFSYVIAPDKDLYKFYVIEKKGNDGFLINETHVLTPRDIAFFDERYQTSISKLQANNCEIIHFGALENNSFKFQLNKSNYTIVANQVSSKLDDDVLNEIANKISQNSKSKNIIITRDDFLRNNPNNDASSFFAENDFISFKSKRINPQKIIEELRVRFPNKNFYMGGDLSKDISSINSVPKINSVNDVTAITAPKSLEVQYDLIRKVSSKFQEKNIKVISLDNPLSNENDVSSNVILITGNKDQKFEEYLAKLFKEVDLKDKVLVTFSCFKEGSDYLNTFLIKNFKTNSIIYFPTKINPDATKKVLLEFSELLSKNTEQKTIKELMEQSIEIMYNSETIPFLKNEIGKLRQFIIQLSINSSLNLKENKAKS